jgi:HD-GYP domain-containing protein (c-di-GMP phosphodiesterase class II)
MIGSDAWRRYQAARDARGPARAVRVADRLAQLRAILGLVRQLDDPLLGEDVGPLIEESAAELDLLAKLAADTSTAETMAFARLVEPLEIKVHDVERRARRLVERRRILLQTRRLHDRIASAAGSLLSEARELAASIIDEVDAGWYPDLEIGAGASPADTLAIHGANVARVLASLTARDWRWKADRERIVIAGLVADIGMRGVPVEIFAQPGPLPERLRGELIKHPLYSAAVLQKTDLLDAELISAVSMHHERPDGSGYPNRLGAPLLSETAGLLAIADGFAARRLPKAWRGSMSQREALTDLLAEADAGRLDVKLATGLLHLSMHEPGSVVELATGEVAEVIAPQAIGAEVTDSALPLVRLRLDATGAPVIGLTLRNLALRPDCRIVRTLADPRTRFESDRTEAATRRAA